MADRKISDLTALTTPASGDFLPIVDISEAAAANKNKRITIEELMRGAPDGTAAAPGIAFETDPNTGIYSPGADQLAVATNGTQRINIEADGDINIDGGGVFYDATNNRLAIGTTSPSATLELSGTGTVFKANTATTTSTAISLQLGGLVTSSNSGCFIKSHVNLGSTLNSQLSFEVNGGALEAARIDSSGRVGIGTSSPTAGYLLDCRGNVKFGSPSTAGVYLGVDSNIPFIQGFDSGATYNQLKFLVGGTEAVRIDSSGRLLVGTSTANGSGLLQVNGGYNILKGFNRRPPLHRGPLFTKTAATTISVVADCSLNGFFYSTATAVTMGAHVDNTDMAIWQNPTTGALVSDASYTTAPAGATGGTIVGGYHYIPSGRPTAFNNGSPTAAPEILEFSIWDLTWRPECPDPRGMTCVDGRFWCDLYLCGSTSYAGTNFSAVPSSKIGLTIADTSSPPLIPGFYGGNGSTAYTGINNQPGSWYNFTEVAHSFGKRLMFSWEFQAAAFGAPEAGSRGADPGTVIWERESKWGLAQATGTMLSWAIERVGIFSSGSNTNTGGRGTEFADAPRALSLGGSWNGGTASGSRSAEWTVGPFYGSPTTGARFAAGHLILG